MGLRQSVKQRRIGTSGSAVTRPEAKGPLARLKQAGGVFVWVAALASAPPTAPAWATVEPELTWALYSLTVAPDVQERRRSRGRSTRRWSIPLRSLGPIDRSLNGHQSC